MEQKINIKPLESFVTSRSNLFMVMSGKGDGEALIVYFERIKCWCRKQDNRTGALIDMSFA